MSQQINLFNDQFEHKKQRFTARTMVLSAAVLALGLAAMGLYADLRVARLRYDAEAGAVQLDKAQKRLASVSAEFAPRASDPGLTGQLSEADSQLAALQRVSDTIKRGDLGNTKGYAEYFRALARQRVEGLWLTGVSIGGAGQDIGVRGRAMDPAMVPGFLTRLRNEPVMQGKPIGSLQIGEAPSIKVPGKDGKDDSAPAPYVEFSLQSAPQPRTKP
jgi:hypothetical protein